MNRETEDGVYALLDQAHIPYHMVRHPEAATMQVCQGIEQELGARICKNLLLCNRQQTDFYLLLMPGDKPFKTKYLSAQLGCARLSFASEEHMLSLLHIRPGSVSPMGLMHDTDHRVRLIVDSDLAGDEYLGCHPCVNTATLRLTMHDLLHRFLPLTGHDYTLVQLPRETSEP